MTEFDLHPRLKADCHRLGRFAICHLLLQRNAQVPWFVLVPQVDTNDLLGLPAALRNAILEECSQVAAFVRAHFGSPHINFAAIGNVVPQLHLHVVGRGPEDACWPRPVWGNLPGGKSYPAEALSTLTRRLKADWGLLRVN